MSVQKCSDKSIKSYAVLNGFIESKKLTLKVNEEAMKDSVHVKYLVDIIHSSGRIQPTIEDRRDKGFSICY